MVRLIKKKGETKETLFRKFTRAFIEEDIINEVKNKLFYKKPSLVKKEQQRERRKNIAKKYDQHHLLIKV